LADLNLDNTSIGLLIAPLTLRLTALPFPGDQVNAVLLVPAGRLNDDFGKRPLARAITTQRTKAGAIEDPHSDAITYLWQTGQGKPGATIFVGKQAK
jgi:hypothetical protein